MQSLGYWAASRISKSCGIGHSMRPITSRQIWIRRLRGFFRVTANADAWRKVVAEYRVDLFCALYLERPNRGVSLSPKTMAELGARGVEIGFDIYAP